MSGGYEGQRRKAHHPYDPAEYAASERRAANERSRNEAESHGEPWTQYEDDLLVEFWIGVPAAERDEAEVARMLGRTIVACAVRASNITHNRVSTYRVRRTRKVTRTAEGTTTEETLEVTRKQRPAWMDEEGLPDWYV